LGLSLEVAVRVSCPKDAAADPPAARNRKPCQGLPGAWVSETQGEVRRPVHPGFPPWEKLQFYYTPFPLKIKNACSKSPPSHMLVALYTY
jgi:hypothetical protein